MKISYNLIFRLLLILMIYPLVINTYISFVGISRAEGRVFAVIFSLITIAFFFFGFLYVLTNNFKVKNNFFLDRNFILLNLFSCLFIFVSMFIGLVNGNATKYILGDSFRYLIFPVSALCLSFYMSKYDRIFLFLKFILCIFFISVTLKIVLLVSGSFYGAGLNQYYPGSFLITLFFCFAFMKDKNLNYDNNKKFIVYFFIALVVGVLSFKRANWIAIIFLLFSLILIVRLRLFRISIIFIVMIPFLVYFLDEINLISMILNRFHYTFSGKDGLDSSSMQRVGEIVGVINELENYNFLVFLFGLGSGAEFVVPTEYSLFIRNPGSEPHLSHHIHTFYFLMLFRFGIIGLLLYLLPVFYVLYKLVVMYSRFENSPSKKIFILASIMEILFYFVNALKGNAFYGNYLFSYFLVFSLIVLKTPEKKFKDNGFV